MLDSNKKKLVQEKTVTISLEGKTLKEIEEELKGVEPPTWFTVGDNERYLGEVNKVLGGVVVSQTRYKIQECDVAIEPTLTQMGLGPSSEKKTKLQALYATCFAAKAEGNASDLAPTSNKAYGSDPALMEVQSPPDTIYSAEAVESFARLYNTSESEFGNNVVEPIINPVNNVPYGFHHLGKYVEGSMADRGYLVFFDTEINAARSANIMTYLTNGFFLDELTKSVKVQVMTYNGKMKMFALTTVEFTIENDGAIRLEWSVSTFKYSYYTSEKDQTRLVIEIIVIALTFLTLIGELREMYTERFKYFTDFWNLLDLGHVALLDLIMFDWLTLNRGPLTKFMPSSRYKIYNDLASSGRYFQMNNTGNHAELRRLLSDTTMCDEIIISLQSHYMLQMMALLVFVIRILKYMDFQPRLGIITRTLRVAAVDLFHFSIVSLHLLRLPCCPCSRCTHALARCCKLLARCCTNRTTNIGFLD